MPRDGPLALLDEHVPQLVALAPLPLHLAQRRDQHAARERQLDAGPAADVRVEALRRRPEEGPPGDRHRRLRLVDVRQRPRAARPRGPLAPARADDDGAGAVEPARVDERRAEGVLRVPLLLPGAVGRPGLHRLHRRHPDRRDPRPQRPAALALGPDEGRPRRHGLRGRRPRLPAGEGRGEGAPPARPDLPRRHRRGAGRPGPRDQGDARRGRPLRGVAEGAPRPPEGPARPARRPRARPRDRPDAPGDVRLHARGRPDDREPDGRRGDGADRVDGDGHPARRPVRGAAAPLRLLQAALRPGDEPAGRRGPRGDRHGGRHGDRPGGKPPRADARGGAPLRAADARPPERRAREGPLARRGPRLARLPVDLAPDPLQGEGRREGAPESHRGAAAPLQRGDRRGAQHPDPLRPRPRRDRRADPGAPRAVGGAAPPAARRVADPRRPRPRDRASRARSTTSASSSATARAPSTPTSRSRRSTTRSGRGCSPATRRPRRSGTSRRSTRGS